jgi:hypothetical protein
MEGRQTIIHQQRDKKLEEARERRKVTRQKLSRNTTTNNTLTNSALV